MFTVDSEGTVTEDQKPDPGLLIITAINTRTGEADVVLQGRVVGFTDNEDIILDVQGERIVIIIDDESVL